MSGAAYGLQNGIDSVEGPQQWPDRWLLLRLMMLEKRETFLRKGLSMEKTPTIFLRDFDGNPKFVTRNPNSVCDWVFAGAGQATRKYDGTCCMFDGTQWFKRREVKPDKQPPHDFRQVHHDQTTGKLMGWVPVRPDDKWHLEAISRGDHLRVGTYELCGPRVQGNPERFDTHVMIAHADTEILDPPRDFDGLKDWMGNTTYEGIVFHHADGRMAKIKRRDFGF